MLIYLLKMLIFQFTTLNYQRENTQTKAKQNANCCGFISETCEYVMFFIRFYPSIPSLQTAILVWLLHVPKNSC